MKCHPLEDGHASYTGPEISEEQLRTEEARRRFREHRELHSNQPSIHGAADRAAVRKDESWPGE